MLLDIAIRKADANSDLEPVLALLRGAALPTDGVEDHFANFLVAVDGGYAIVGAIGLERYADGTGLLRSAVVEPMQRGSGIGSRLYDELIKSARASGISRLMLLTTTAEKFFGQRGFRAVPRTAIMGPVTASTEFRGACPATAVCMEMLLD
jgi:amino-acid N-acetyltransferase